MQLHYALANLMGHGHQGRRIDDVRPGVELLLRREPGNLVDPNAIVVEAVVATHGKEPVKVGYVPATLAARLAPQMDAGRVFKAVFVGGEPRLKMMILAADQAGDAQLSKLKRL